MRIKRAAALVGVVAVASTAVGVTAGAHAQSGSRLCGVAWTSLTTHEVFVKLYEYPKDDAYLCIVPTDPKKNPPWAQSFVQEKRHSAWLARDFADGVCESFRKDFMKGMDFRRVGPGFPPRADHTDICNNMNRSDTGFELERYFAYYNGDAENKAWDFRRD